MRAGPDGCSTYSKRKIQSKHRCRPTGSCPYEAHHPGMKQVDHGCCLLPDSYKSSPDSPSCWVMVRTPACCFRQGHDQGGNLYCAIQPGAVPFHRVYSSPMAYPAPKPLQMADSVIWGGGRPPAPGRSSGTGCAHHHKAVPACQAGQLIQKMAGNERVMPCSRLSFNRPAARWVPPWGSGRWRVRPKAKDPDCPPELRRCPAAGASQGRNFGPFLLPGARPAHQLQQLGDAVLAGQTQTRY